MHAILVNNQTIDQGAIFQKRVPITTIAGQARSLYREHCTGGAGTDRGQQIVKAGTCRPARRVAEVLVNNNHILPTQRLRAILEAILTAPTLRIVDELAWC